MGRKERNTLSRLERENKSRIKKNTRLYVKSLEEISGELIETMIEVHSTPPSVEEWAALNDLLESSSGLYYKPRRRKVYSWDDSNLKKWQCLGFSSLEHYITYNQINNTVAGLRELDGLFLTENDNYD
ncbi:MULTISPECIES: hypothetical protein [Enterobacteriaceae]|uniref:Uncharacterized protein n=1 Tax=Citrobacter werkmanii TaxID=67827 RepID=A0A9N8CLY6_9ENTR|nr:MULTISPECIES: hypothetical protein [Enterobacteriaceae]MBJ8718108.1 hypothetical protein [Citrobacter freundii]CAB5518924.1 Uncharacterised protein [Citrobacter werkmanii]CAB5523554.1 Uncharacterised protein [Citrobacter werkmanii]CAB5525974.1 Uncharacterised protein [Citrobacter werkmanii]CAB5533367.1 Uncharacterised protein [Citrobacter werkmanii]